MKMSKTLKVFVFTYPDKVTGKSTIVQIYAENVRRAADNLALITGVPEYMFSIHGQEPTTNPLDWPII